MTQTWLAFGIAVLLTVAFVLALIDVAFDYFSKISIRTYREESWKTEYLTDALEDPMSFLLPLRIGLQGAFTATTVLVTMLFLTAGTPQPLLMAFAAMFGAFLVFREAVPNIIARKNPERVLLKLLPAYRVYAKLVTPISRPLSRFVGVFVNESEDEEVVTEQTCRRLSKRARKRAFSKATKGVWCSPSSTSATRWYER